MTDCGYAISYSYRGEAITVSDSSATAGQALASWQASPPHNALLLDPTYVAAGISRVVDPLSDWGYYWTLDVASALDSALAVATAVPTSTGVPPTATNLPPTATKPPATPTSVPATPTRTATSAPTQTASPTVTRTPTVSPIQTTGATGGGLLVNPGFESGLAGWDRPSWFSTVADVETSVAHSGSRAFWFHGKSSGPYVQQTVVAKGGQTVTVSGSVNVSAYDTGMNGAIELVALNSYGGTLATYTVYSFSGTTTGWVPVSNTRVLPSSTASVRLRVRFTMLDGTAYLDDLELR
jgi:uncharacterized protein YkwD